MSETVKAQAEDRTPMALLPYQQAWCADQSPVKLCEKSRRIGLSWGEAADTALLAASGSGMDAWYIGYNKDMALEFIRDCANWAKFYNLAAGVAFICRALGNQAGGFGAGFDGSKAALYFLAVAMHGGAADLVALGLQPVGQLGVIREA